MTISGLASSTLAAGDLRVEKVYQTVRDTDTDDEVFSVFATFGGDVMVAEAVLVTITDLDTPSSSGGGGSSTPTTSDGANVGGGGGGMVFNPPTAAINGPINSVPVVTIWTRPQPVVGAPMWWGQRMRPISICSPKVVLLEDVNLRLIRCSVRVGQ